MKIFLTLLLGAAIGAAAVWFLATQHGQHVAQKTGDQIGNAAKSANDAVQDQLKSWNLTPDDIKDELARTGQVIRRGARQAGQAIADGTADARITGAIKVKLGANRDLSAMSISVNTTAGVVTLSGTVPSRDAIGKAILIAMDTDGVREVISTLQVKPN